MFGNIYMLAQRWGRTPGCSTRLGKANDIAPNASGEPPPEVLVFLPAVTVGSLLLPWAHTVAGVLVWRRRRLCGSVQLRAGKARTARTRAPIERAHWFSPDLVARVIAIYPPRALAHVGCYSAQTHGWLVRARLCIGPWQCEFFRADPDRGPVTQSAMAHAKGSGAWGTLHNAATPRSANTMRYIIVNSNAVLVRALERCWAQAAPSTSPSIRVEIFHGTVASFFAAYAPEGAATVVSPANSVSFMGGGYDRALLQALAPALDYRTAEAAVQARALARHHGYVPPGAVHRVELEAAFGAAGVAFETTAAHRKNITTLLQAPTMVVPEHTSGQCVFDCVWNVLGAADTGTVILPAFGAGYGGVAAETVARVMAGAVALWHAPLEGLAQAAAVLVFLQKDHRRLENAQDVAAVERYLSRHGRARDCSAAATGGTACDWPTPWPELVRCVPALENNGSEW